MQLFGSEILGLGRGLPDRIMHNSELEKIVETSSEWIKSRTGIEKRYIAAEDEATSDLCAKAAVEALEKANVDASEIDLIIVATMSPDYMYPATAALVQYKIGAVNAGAFDLMAACSGFVYALVTAENFIRCGRYKKILVIGGEVFSKILNWKDRNSCVLFGDGASAAVISQTEDSSKGIISFELGADGSGFDKLIAVAGGTKNPITAEALEKKEHLLTMKGSDIFKFAVRIIPESIQRVLAKTDYKLDDIKLIVPHQANYRILESAAKRLGVGMDKFFMNMDKYANTSAASIGLALYDAFEEGALKKGDLTLLIGFGAGLTHATCIVRL
ncbi:MAG: ketoacyl-ACP synthase III [Fusobacteria bacterium]|nr:ketoacyl-ACP synthase III [Fusobacteriota bacterium]